MSDMTEQRLQKITDYLDTVGRLPKTMSEALIAEVRRLREQEQTIRLEMARDALNESEDLAGRLNAVLADAGIVVDTTYDVAFRTLLHQRDAALAERDMWKARAESNVQVVRLEPRAKDLAAALATIDGLVDMAKANPTQHLAHALRTVAIVSQDVSALPEAPHGEEA